MLNIIIKVSFFRFNSGREYSISDQYNRNENITEIFEVYRLTNDKATRKTGK